MAIFVIVLDAPSTTAWEAVKECWPDRHFMHSDRVAYIVDAEWMLTRTVAEKIGICDGGLVWGLVIEVKHYSGTADRTLVEWLSKT